MSPGRQLRVWHPSRTMTSPHCPPRQGKCLLLCKTEGGGRGEREGWKQECQKGGLPGDGRISAPPTPSRVCFSSLYGRQKIIQKTFNSGAGESAVGRSAAYGGAGFRQQVFGAVTELLHAMQVVPEHRWCSHRSLRVRTARVVESSSLNAL